MNVAPRTAVSLYVALAVHVLLLLGLALSPPSQNSVGPGLGLSIPGAGLDAVERRMATELPSTAQLDSSVAEASTAAGSEPAAIPSPNVRVESDVALTESRPPRSKRPGRSETAKANRDKAATSLANDRDSADRAGQVGGGGEARYYARLRAHLARYRHELPGGLPAAKARVRFRVSADGWISELELFESSGLAALDAEAMDLLRRAAPLPPPPEGRAARLIVPVSIGGPG